MIKSFLILMLMTTQLLAGGGGSVYLCIRNDGSFCCFDLGPTSCTCCEEPVPSLNKQDIRVVEKSSGCSCCGEELSETCDDGQADQRTKELSGFSGNPCDCTHILLSNEQVSARPVRTSAAGDVEQLSQITADLSYVTTTDWANLDRHSLVQRFRPPSIRSQSLTVLSWVLIQC